MRRIGVSLLMFLLVGGTSRGFAQTSNTGVVTGNVMDEQGLSLTGATVELINTATRTSRSLVTESSGSFTFSAIDPATYTLKVTMQGFRTNQRTGIQRVQSGHLDDRQHGGEVRPDRCLDQCTVRSSHSGRESAHWPTGSALRVLDAWEQPREADVA
jgi:hypothetical protein